MVGLFLLESGNKPKSLNTPIIFTFLMKHHKFFARKSDEAAIELLGRLLIRTTDKGATAGRIIQTGAYEGGNETPSRAGMKYAPGTIFLMPYRGSYLLNIATDREGYPSCVEIRQVAYHDKIIDGSGAITKHLGIEGLDGILLGEKLQIAGEPVERANVKRVKGNADNCLGYYLIR